MLQTSIYIPTDNAELLRLLLQLQKDYFRAGASALVDEIEKERDTEGIYKRYIQELESEMNEGTAIIFMTRNNSGGASGFIIGRIAIDNDLVFNKIGVVEDWFIEENVRKTGIGISLYKMLEDWFRKNGCQHLQSSTWSWNKRSIDLHHQLGFETSELKFVKKL